jgi:hypothetical protein
MMPCSPAFGARRLLYWILLACSAIGFLGLICLSFTRGAYGPWLIIFFAGGFGGTALLSVWCAIHLTQEPALVRVALLWTAALFVFLLVVVFTAGNVH